MPPVSRPLRASNQATSEFEFHMSPVCSSSRPQVAVGKLGTSSSIRCALTASKLIRSGLATASATSGMMPLRHRRTS